MTEKGLPSMPCLPCVDNRLKETVRRYTKVRCSYPDMILGMEQSGRQVLGHVEGRSQKKETKGRLQCVRYVSREEKDEKQEQPPR